MLGTKEQYAARGIPQPDGALKPVSKAYLSKRRIVDMLRPAMEVDPADGKLKVNFEKADALLIANRDPARSLGKREARAAAPADDGALQTYESVKKEQALVKLEEQRLDLAGRKGDTLPRTGVMAAAAASGQLIREHLQARNRRLAELAATMTDARAIKAKLDEEDRVMLEMVSNDFMRRIPGHPESGGELTTH